MNQSISNMSLTALSQREAQVLQLISQEFTSSEIATKLYISVCTVETHRRNLLIKLDARNVAGMIRRGFENGILI